VLALTEALERLEAVDARKSEIVHLRYFLGLTIEETAVALAIAPTTVKDDWTLARAWLKRAIDGGGRGTAE
jgi:DNA-directed RNA polymerase specialized sigma24 family protein